MGSALGPFDPSFLSKPVQIDYGPSPVESYGKYLSLKGMMDQQKIRQIQLQQEQMQLEQQKQAAQDRANLQSYLKTANLNDPAAVQQLYTYGPSGTAVAENLRKQKTENLDAQIKQNTINAERLGKYTEGIFGLQDVTDPQARLAEYLAVSEDANRNGVIDANELGNRRALTVAPDAQTLANDIFRHGGAKVWNELQASRFKQQQEQLTLADKQRADAQKALGAITDPTGRVTDIEGYAALVKQYPQYFNPQPDPGRNLRFLGFDEKKAGEMRAEAAATLGAAQSQDEYNATFEALGGRIPDEVLAPFEDKTPAQARLMGMKPSEQATALKEPNVTEAQLAQIATNPNASPDQRAAAERALKRLDQSKREARPVIGAGTLPGFQISPQNAQLTGEEFLATLPPSAAAEIKAMAEGRVSAPSSSSRAAGAQQKRAALFQYDPQFSEQRAQLRKNFMSGKQGDNIGALNTAMVHLDQFAAAADALHNGNFRPGNEAWNSLAAMFGSSAPTNFAGLKTAVSGELATALKGNATDQEIRHIQDVLESKNSPDQLRDYVTEQLHVLGAKLNTYTERYRAGNPADTTWTPVLPSARAVLSRRGITGIEGAGGQTVKMQAPNGQVKDVPADQVKHFEQLGAKRI